MTSNSNSNGDMLSVSSSANWLIDSWILDSACSFHITRHKDWFNIYKSVNCGFVLKGNDAACKIVGIGTIKTRMDPGGGLRGPEPKKKISR